MNKFIHFLFLFIFLSCASKQGKDYIPESRDDLSTESLSRKEKISESKVFTKNLITNCYNNKSNSTKDITREKLDNFKNSFSYWSSIASCYLHQNQLQKAHFFYKVSLSKIKNRSQRAIYLNNIGVYYTRVNRLNLAIDFFYDSIASDKTYKTPHMNLAMIYAQYGLNKKARRQLAHFNGSDDPHIIYIKKIVNTSKDVTGYFPGYITEDERKDTISKVSKK